MPTILLAILIMISFTTAAANDKSPCTTTGTACDAICTDENKTDLDHLDYQGYCGTGPTGHSTAQSGCLCPNNKLADNQGINTACEEAINYCNNKQCTNDGSCSDPNNEPGTVSQCTCSAPY